MSVFDDIKGQQARIDTLGQRVVALRDRMIGAQAERATGEIPVSIFGGEIGDLENIGNRARGSVNDALDALDQLEKIFA